MNKKVKLFSEAGKGKAENSDFIFVKDYKDGLISIVCDGLGEGNGPDSIAKICAESVVDFFTSSCDEDIINRIKSAISHSNEYIYTRSDEMPRLQKTATTIDLFYLQDHTAYWGHVGDSRIYNLKNGKLHRLTKDHSLVQQLVDEGFLTMKEADFHPNKNVISRALGEAEQIVIDTSKIHLSPFDKHRFFICTDGVFNVINDDELEEFLLESEIENCGEKIISEVELRGAEDDFSFIIVDH